MKACGIIVEYNPFHNGHLLHINKAKELTNPDVLIACCSGNYVQRGEPSIINKFEKTKAALNAGIDLIVEMPYIYTIQNATVFGKTAVKILNDLKVESLVFGSETNNLDELSKIADLNINIDHLKEKLDKGLSYPKAYGLLTSFLYPNDMLAVSYLKALKDSNIKPYSIQRTNDYNSLDLNNIASAMAIRKALKEKKDIKYYCPINIENPIFIEDFYPYLRKCLITKHKDELKNIFLVNEGIENLLIKNAYNYNNYEDFINNSISKRYTKARINRISLNIMNNIKKDDVINLPNLNYIRVLGFNKKGRLYLNSIKKKVKVPIYTNFNKDLELELKVTKIYSLIVNDESLIKKEIKNIIIKK